MKIINITTREQIKCTKIKMKNYAEKIDSLNISQVRYMQTTIS